MSSLGLGRKFWYALCVQYSKAMCALSVSDGERIGRVVDAVTEEFHTRGVGRDDAAVVEVVDSRATAAFCISALHESECAGHIEFVVAIGTGAVVAYHGADGAAYIGHVGQADNETCQPHAEVGVAAQGCFVDFVSGFEVCEIELRPLPVDGGVLAHVVECGVEARYCVCIRKYKIGRKVTVDILRIACAGGQYGTGQQRGEKRFRYFHFLR